MLLRVLRLLDYLVIIQKLSKKSEGSKLRGCSFEKYPLCEVVIVTKIRIKRVA